jgi:hypothetical protein
MCQFSHIRCYSHQNCLLQFVKYLEMGILTRKQRIKQKYLHNKKSGPRKCDKYVSIPKTDETAVSVTREALVPTQSPIQWVPAVLPGDKARPGRDAVYSHLVPTATSRSYFSFLSCRLHGGSGTSLPISVSA